MIQQRKESDRADLDYRPLTDPVYNQTDFRTIIVEDTETSLSTYNDTQKAETNRNAILNMKKRRGGNNYTQTNPTFDQNLINKPFSPEELKEQ
jgi:hypothetical protein